MLFSQSESMGFPENRASRLSFPKGIPGACSRGAARENGPERKELVAAGGKPIRYFFMTNSTPGEGFPSYMRAGLYFTTAPNFAPVFLERNPSSFTPLPPAARILT